MQWVLSHPGPVSTHCVAVGVCRTKSLQWGLGGAVYWVFPLPALRWGQAAANAGGGGCPPVGLVWVGCIGLDKRGLYGMGLLGGGGGSRL